jgi:hypothetical protein
LRPLQVNDITARADAVALYQFLLGRGYILPDVSPTSTPAVANCDVSLPRLPSPFPALKRKATPLTGVDMIKVSTVLALNAALMFRHCDRGAASSRCTCFV